MAEIFLKTLSFLIFIGFPVLLPIVMWQFLKIKDSKIYRPAKIMRQILAFLIFANIAVSLSNSDLTQWEGNGSLFFYIIVKVVVIYCLLTDWPARLGSKNGPSEAQ